VSTARTKKRAAEAAGFTIKLALGLVFISPLIIGLFFSFQTEQELMSYPLHLLPQHFTLENYQAVFAKVPLLLYLKNSVKKFVRKGPATPTISTNPQKRSARG